MFLSCGMFGGIDSDVAAHWGRMTSTDTDQKNDISNLILGLKEDGVWDLIEMLNVVHDNEADSLLDITGNAHDSSKYSTPAFVADRGFTTAAGKAIKTGIDSFTGVYQDDDNSLFFYRRTQADTGNTRNIMGAFDYNWDDKQMIYQFYATATEHTIYHGGSAVVKSASTYIGFTASSRTSSSDVRVFKDGFSTPYSVSSDDVYPAPRVYVTDLVTHPVWVGGYVNYYGDSVLESAGLGAQDQYSAWGVGGGMSHSELTYLYNRVTTYLTARGAI